MNLSIRWRLTLWYFLVLILGFGLFGLLMWLHLEHNLTGAVETRLVQRYRGLERTLKSEADIHNREQLQQELAEFDSGITDGLLVEFRDRAGVSLLPQSGPLVLPASPVKTPGLYTISVAAEPYRAFQAPLEVAGETWNVELAYPLDDVERMMRQVRLLSVAWAQIVLLLACAGGYWLSGLALRPVDEITAVAKSISLQNLSQRIPAPRTGDALQRMADTWNQVLERLDAAVSRIRRFTADASHELRSPLALVRATAELALRKERAPEEYRSALRDIQTQAELMTDLTESMLLIARADFEGFDVPLAPTDLNALVAAETAQNSIAIEKGVQMRTATDPQIGQVAANGAAIQRLLRILIENAIRHTPPGGVVTVSTARRDGTGVLTVADTGEGISQADLPHIFDRFYRADLVRTSGSGFGLGLSIAQAIAQAHQSKITVESGPGQGSRFSLALRIG